MGAASGSIRGISGMICSLWQLQSYEVLAFHNDSRMLFWLVRFRGEGSCKPIGASNVLERHYCYRLAPFLASSPTAFQALASISDLNSRNQEFNDVPLET